MASAGGVKRIQEKARPSVSKRPAQAISSFPSLSPVSKAPPPRPAGELWYGGPKVQKPWLKQVQKSFQLCRSKGNPKKGETKSKATSVAFKAGVPPPPMPDVIMSLKLMAQWNARWDDLHVSSKDWRPERNVIVIAGRPVCVLMVSHQGAKALEWDSYHNLIFGPLRPVVLLGPTGHSAQAPKMQPKFSVIEWWKVFVFSGLWEPTLHEKMARLLLFLPRPLRLPRPYPHLPTPPRPTPPSRPHTLSRRRLCSLEIPVFLTRDYATTITRKLACRT